MRYSAPSFILEPSDTPTVREFHGHHWVDMAGSLGGPALHTPSTLTPSEQLDVLDRWVERLAHELAIARTRLGMAYPLPSDAAPVLAEEA